MGGAKVAVPSGPSSIDKSQPGSSQHSLPAKEEPRAGEEKPKPPRAAEDAGLDAVVPRSVSDHVPIKQEPTVATVRNILMPVRDFIGSMCVTQLSLLSVVHYIKNTCETTYAM